MVGKLKANLEEKISKDILRAIEFYLNRQQIVFDFLFEIGINIDWMGKWGAIAWTYNKKYENLDEDELANFIFPDDELFEVVKRAQALHLQQSGIWKGWKYFLHGKGCYLENLESGEPIDWDCPNRYSLDPYAFIKHLEWRLEKEPGTDELKSIMEYINSGNQGLQDIIDLVSEMRAKGLLK